MYLSCATDMDIFKSGIIHGCFVITFDNYDEGNGDMKFNNSFSEVVQSVIADHYLAPRKQCISA